MFARDAFVPVPERLPFSAIGGRTENIALACQDEIGMDRELEVRQAGVEEINGTSGIDSPKHAVGLQAFDGAHATFVQHRVLAVRDEGSIEIGAKQTDSGGHEGANLEGSG